MTCDGVVHTKDYYESHAIWERKYATKAINRGLNIWVQVHRVVAGRML